MLDRARPFLFPLLLALWGAALLAQNFLLLPVGWRLAPAALILLGAYLLWRGDWPASSPQDTARARLNERHFRLPRAESLSASLVIDSGPVDLRLEATTDKVPAGAATATATLLTGEYAAAPPTLNRHFQHATILPRSPSTRALRLGGLAPPTGARIALADRNPQLAWRAAAGLRRAPARERGLQQRFRRPAFHATTARQRPAHPAQRPRRFAHPYPTRPQLPRPHPRQPLHARPYRPATLCSARRWHFRRWQPR